MKTFLKNYWSGIVGIILLKMGVSIWLILGAHIVYIMASITFSFFRSICSNSDDEKEPTPLNNFTNEPISEDVRKYLQGRVEQLNICKAKETTTYCQYSDQDLKYMGMGKN